MAAVETECAISDLISRPFSRRPYFEKIEIIVTGSQR